MMAVHSCRSPPARAFGGRCPWSAVLTQRPLADSELKRSQFPYVSISFRFGWSTSHSVASCRTWHIRTMEQELTSERAWRWGVWSASDREWQVELETRQALQIPTSCSHPIEVALVSASTKVPRIIHHIWLGPREIPYQCVTWMESWRRHHPEWTHRIWRDADVDAFGLKNEKAYAKANNYGEKSDILRYEVLERLGGVYVDVDMQCLQPIDFLVESFSFVVGISNTGCVEINNAVIASTPGHPILKRLVEKILARTNQPRLDASMLARITQLSGVDLGAMRDSQTAMSTIERTGPGLMTRTFMEAVGWTTASGARKSGFLGTDDSTATAALPVEIFYPLPNDLTEEARRAITQFPSRSVAAHHWQRTWMTGTA